VNSCPAPVCSKISTGAPAEHTSVATASIPACFLLAIAAVQGITGLVGDAASDPALSNGSSVPRYSSARALFGFASQTDFAAGGLLAFLPIRHTAADPAVDLSDPTTARTP